MANVVKVLLTVRERLLEEVRQSPLRECCGFLAGRDGVITEVLPAPNALASATAFQIAPAELFRLVRQMRARGLDHLGIYHSHPAGENSPSATDIKQVFYPAVAYFILSPLVDAAEPVRAFSIRDEKITELTIELVPG